VYGRNLLWKKISLMRSPRHNTSFEIPNQVGKRLQIRTD
jgi:hypothetical protein